MLQGLDHKTTLALLRFWVVPAGIAVAAAAFSLGLGFLHGGTSNPLVTAGTRYTWHLPSDNGIPVFFANQLLSSHRPLPHFVVPGWLSSDRPPLQTAVYLLIRAVLPISDPHGLWYQVTGTFLQCLWAPALWCLLYVVGISRRATACALSLVALSGFVIVNSFFAWPKLFPAALLVLLAACVLTQDWDDARERLSSGIACGLAAGLAILGHEGSVFALVPLLLLVLVMPRRRPRPRVALAAFGMVVALIGPWMLYQRYYDPPGDALAKVQLAGQTKWNSNQSLESAITHAYGQLGIAQIAHNKWSNLTTPISGEPREVKGFVQLMGNLFGGGQSGSRRTAAVQSLRILNFYNLLPSLGLVALGPFAYAFALWRRRERMPDLVVAARMWAVVVLILALWALVEFGPGATVMFQGTYATELLIYAAATIGFWHVSPRLLTAVAVVQGAAGLALYAVARAPWPDVSLSRHIDSGELLLMTAGLIAVIVLPFLAPRHGECGERSRSVSTC
ncbi:MAG: hypothetical protein ABSB99_04040 [Acidimicrobiales bacterium]